MKWNLQLTPIQPGAAGTKQGGKDTQNLPLPEDLSYPCRNFFLVLEDIFWHTVLPGSDKFKGSFPTIESPQLIKWSLITDLMSWDTKETKASPSHQTTCAKLSLSMSMKSWADPQSHGDQFSKKFCFRTKSSFGRNSDLLLLISTLRNKGSFGCHQSKRISGTQMSLWTTLLPLAAADWGPQLQPLCKPAEGSGSAQ